MTHEAKFPGNCQLGCPQQQQQLPDYRVSGGSEGALSVTQVVKTFQV